MSWKKTLLFSLGILLSGALVTTLIFSTEPSAKRAGATQQTAMLVDVIKAERGTFSPNIQAMGTVEPAQDIVLSARVSGEVIKLGRKFTPGGYVEKGDTLLQIDPSDYRQTLQQRQSELSQATSDLTLEMGLQEAARKEFESYGDSLSEENKARVLRQPQLKAAKARVQSARAAVKQAKLNLQRTTVRAPFDAHILSRNINVGSQVAAGNNLGRLVGLDEYWIEATVPVSSLQWISIPNDNSRGTPVKLRNRTAWPENTYRTGYIHKLLGSLGQETRMARILISVPDPQAYHSEAEKPRLMIGSFVEATIRGEQLSDVVRLNRDHLRENETVWVMQDGKLDIRDVEIVFRDARFAYISEGLQNNDQIVTTNLSTVTDGAPLRLQGSEQPSGQDTLSSE